MRYNIVLHVRGDSFMFKSDGVKRNIESVNYIVYHDLRRVLIINLIFETSTHRVRMTMIMTMVAQRRVEVGPQVHVHPLRRGV